MDFETENWHQHLKHVKVSVDAKPRLVTFKYPGIPKWTFESYIGGPELMHLYNITFDCMSFANPYYNEKKKKGTETEGQFMLFRTESELQISRALWNKSIPKQPLVAKFFKGKRSGPFETRKVQLLTHDLKSILVTDSMTVVLVDRETRKPTKSIPQWLKEEDGLEASPSGLKLERLKKRPQDTYQVKYIVLISDVDINNHATALAYVRLCNESLLRAISAKEMPCTLLDKGYGSTDVMVNGDVAGTDGGVCPISGCNNQKFPQHLTWNVVRHGLKTLRSKYLKECMLGEELDVHIWQEEGEPLWVYFVIENSQTKGSQVVFEMSAEYHGPASCL